jgi:hypothetical protein
VGHDSLGVAWTSRQGYLTTGSFVRLTILDAPPSMARILRFAEPAEGNTVENALQQLLIRK